MKAIELAKLWTDGRTETNELQSESGLILSTNILQSQRFAY